MTTKNPPIPCPWIIGKSYYSYSLDAYCRPIFYGGERAGELVRFMGEGEKWEPNGDHSQAAARLDIEPLSITSSPACAVHWWEKAAEKRRRRWSIDIGIDTEYLDGRQSVIIYFDDDKAGNIILSPTGEMLGVDFRHQQHMEALGLPCLAVAPTFSRACDAWAVRWIR